MKTRLTRWSLSLCASAALPWLAGCQKSDVRVHHTPPIGNTSQVAVTSAPVIVSNPPGTVVKSGTNTPAVAAATNPAPATAQALPVEATTPPVPPVPLTVEKAGEKDAPPIKPIVPPVKLSPELLEVVRLAHANVGDQVLKEFINGLNFPSDLTADEIIFLKDIGMADELVTAIIQRRREGVAQGFVRTGSSVVAQGQPPAPQQDPQMQQLPPTTNTAVVTTSLAPEGTVAVAQQPAQTQVIVQQPVVQNYFYESLTPYGTWVHIVDYGWCWRPTVSTLQVGWRPYCDGGRWLWTDAGWYWQSDYSWGWAPFHYGRWHIAGHHGWVWMPGHEWAPAWVTWRHTSSHCGWAPLPPGSHFRAGVGFTFHGSSVSVGFGFGLGHAHYNFVPLGRLHDHRVRHHVLPSTQVAQVYNNSTVINNYVVGNNNTIINGGISADKVSIASRSEIKKVNLREISPAEAGARKADRLERNGATLAVYKPQLPPQSPEPPARLLGQTSARSERAAGSSSTTASSGPNPAIIPSLAGIPLAAPSRAGVTTTAARGGAPGASAASSSLAAGGTTSVPLTVPRPGSVSAPGSSSVSRAQEPATAGAAGSIPNKRMEQRTYVSPGATAPAAERNSLAPAVEPRQVAPRGGQDAAATATVTTPARRLESRESVRSSSGLLAQPQPGMVRQEAPVPSLPQTSPASRGNVARQIAPSAPSVNAPQAPQANPSIPSAPTFDSRPSYSAPPAPSAIRNPRSEVRSSPPPAPVVPNTGPAYSPSVPSRQAPAPSYSPSVPSRPSPGVPSYSPPPAPSVPSRPTPGVPSYSPPPRQAAPSAPAPPPRYEAPRTPPGPPANPGNGNDRAGRNRPN